MLNKQNQDLCWQVLSKYGCEHQMGMVIEECAELQKAVCKIHLNESPGGRDWASVFLKGS